MPIAPGAFENQPVLHGKRVRLDPQLEVYAFSPRAQRSYEKAGFVRGVRRQRSAGTGKGTTSW